MREGLDRDNWTPPSEVEATTPMSRADDPPTSKEFEQLVEQGSRSWQYLATIAQIGPTTYHAVCDPRYCTIITKLKRGGFIEVVGRSKQPKGQLYSITQKGWQALRQH